MAAGQKKSKAVSACAQMWAERNKRWGWKKFPVASAVSGGSRIYTLNCVRNSIKSEKFAQKIYQNS